MTWTLTRLVEDNNVVVGDEGDGDRELSARATRQLADQGVVLCVESERLEHSRDLLLGAANAARLERGEQPHVLHHAQTVEQNVVLRTVADVAEQSTAVLYRSSIGGRK